MVVKTWRWMVLGLILLIALAACQSANEQENTTGTNSEVSNETANQQTEQSGSEAAEGTSQDPEKKDMILSTTTSTQDSGLLDELLPLFEEQTGYNVKTVAVGSGQALAMGERGEADALLTHAPADEEKLVKNGDVINRKRVMYNDFIVLGPADDPAQIKGKPVEEAFVQIADSKAVFVSRGDDSGTHKKELSIWQQAGIDPSGQDWYVESGQGMGDTLRIAAERKGYVLTDRGTYLASRDILGDMEIMVEGDEALLNIYHVMQVNPEKSDLINSAAAEAFVSFMVSDEVQELIGQFGVEEYGEPLFFPDAETENDAQPSDGG
jgi:tungstate transport system substrate-binding protein